MPLLLSPLITRRVVATGFTAMLFGSAASAADPTIYTLDVPDVSARVGEQTIMMARLKLHDGYRFLHAYNNRVGQLSAFDDAVQFEHKAFPGTDEDGVLVFAINVRPTKPGKHAINGVLRFGYAQGNSEMAMISVPVIANVIGTS